MKKLLLTAICIFVGTSASARADDSHAHKRPTLEFITYPSIDIGKSPPAPLTIKAKLSLPPECRQRRESKRKNCPAVVILHGSSGVDARGDFYAQALNQAGIITLEIDMWEARGVSGAANRPPLPIYNYPDAFGALRYLASRPEVDRDRIGELGFSWGAVVTMASATTLYAGQFGGPTAPVFKAHVAHYPVCWVYNNPIPGLAFGTRSTGVSAPLSGAPVLIQIGSEDSYDQGAGPCLALRESLIPAERSLVQVNAYEGAYHGWDRLMVPVTGIDPFAHLGAGGTIQIVPSPDQAYQSRDAVIEFMKKNL